MAEIRVKQVKIFYIYENQYMQSLQTEINDFVVKVHQQRGSVVNIEFTSKYIAVVYNTNIHI